EPQIADELRDLLEQVMFHRHLRLRGVVLDNHELQMSIAGNAIGPGIAPTDAFMKRIHDMEALLYRTAERTDRRPYKEGGRRPKSLEETFELFMSTPRAASFAVTFRIGQQMAMPGMSKTEFVIDEVLECLDLFTR